MPRVQSDDDIRRILDEHAVGRAVRGLGVYGVNALKSLSPSLSALEGKSVTSASVNNERIVVLGVGTCDIVVDLQRTGALEWIPAADEWSPASHSPMPTGRLRLDDGSAIDFKEPAKTKRITFRVTDVRGTAG